MASMDLRPLGEQVIVVFGASSGIGRETALRAGRRGAKVVVAARDREGLESLVTEIRAAGGEATAVPADATDFGQVKAVADRAAETYGRLDTWAHLASVSVYAEFEDTTPEEFRTVVETNLVGQAYGAMAALPHLRRAGRGALVHVSSVEARRALPYQAAYAASKHGMKGMLDALRLELRREKVPVAVVEVLPAGIDTPLFENARTRLGVLPRPVPPVYDPGVAADTILYAAEHGGRELIVGGAGKMMVATQRLSPRVMDTLMLLTGFAGQRTDEPKPDTAPANLDAPLPGSDRIEGRFPGRRFSLYTWLEIHPAARRAITLGAVAGAAALVARRRR